MEDNFKRNGKQISMLAQVESISNFLSKDLNYVDLDATNEFLRTKFLTKQNQSFENDRAMLLPLALPPTLKEVMEPRAKIYQLWLKALLSEIKIYSKFYRNIPISSIYFGGGTPSIVEVKDLEIIMRTLIKNFHINQNAEISLEVNPESLTKEKALAYNKIGFNRISLGVQSFDNANLKSLGRLHDFSQVVEAVKLLRLANFHNVSLDLIWGLAGQSLKDWHRDLITCIDLDPEHISCYGLSLEEGSLFYNLNNDGLLKLPDEKIQAKMYSKTFEVLKSAGYLQYEISNYAKVGFQCRHNLGYWQNMDYLGLGPSATGTLGNIRRTQAKSIIQWAKDIQSGSLEKDLEQGENSRKKFKDTEHFFIREELSSKDKAFEFIMLGLRTSQGVDLKKYTELTQKSLLQEYAQLIKKLSKHGLVRVQNNYLSLSPNGMLVSDSIIEKFLP